MHWRILSHKSAYRRLLCYARCTCHIGMHAMVLSTPQACIRLHYMPHMHAYHCICKCMICRKGTHVAAQCTTQARMQWQNPPHVHASMGTSFTHPIRYLRDARARDPQNKPRAARGDARRCNILMNHHVQPATRKRSSISNRWSKAQSGKWRFPPPPPHTHTQHR